MVDAPKNVDDSDIPDADKAAFIKRRTEEGLAEQIPKHFDFESLYNYDYKNDPNRVIGPTGWLTKGGTCTWIGRAGVGKSSAAIQQNIFWAINQPFFGIQPMRPLKTLLIQSEDDEADMARAVQGVIDGFALQRHISAIKEKLLIFREELTGDNFYNWLDMLCAYHKPDNICINPLLDFFEGDISMQKDAQKFKHAINKILKKHGCVLNIFHHTGKPPKDGVESGMDIDYAGTGSAILTNWTRAVMYLRRVEKKSFELEAGKRGERSGLCDIKGNRVSLIKIKHAEHSVCWGYDVEPVQAQEWNDLTLFLAAIGDNGWEPAENVLRRIREIGKRSESDARIIYKRIFMRFSLDGALSGTEMDTGQGFIYKAQGRDRYFKANPQK